MATAVAPSHEYGGMAMPAEMKAGERSEQQDCQQVVLSCNKEGMDFLRKGQYKQAFEQLKYAEAILVANRKEEDPTSLLAVTCNNLGCYYKKVGKLHAALSYLRKALKIEVSLQTDDVTVAGTHLNICAILSKLDKHDKAVQHALCALELISQRVACAEHAVTQDEYSVLAIAYHNVAVERDFLHQWDQAHAAYQQGHQISKKCLGDQHPLTQTLAKNCETALQKSQKFSKERSLPFTAGAQTAGAAAVGGEIVGRKGPPVLPDIAVSGQKDSQSQVAQEELMPIPSQSVHQDAVQNEEPAWSPSRSGVGPPLSAQGMSQYQSAPPSQQPMLPRNLNSIQMQSMSSEHTDSLGPREPVAIGAANSPTGQWAYSQYLDAMPQDVGATPVMPVAAPASPPPLVMMNREPRRQAKEEKLKVGGQTVDEFMQAPSKPGGPGPGAKVSTKTAREKRMAERMARSGTLTSTTTAEVNSRDEAKLQQSHLLRRRSAEKIQRAFRAHVKYVKDNRDRIRRENASATKIQARWRAYRVRRKRLDKAAVCIQRWTRGHLVRMVIRRHNAAVVIQRHAMGHLARKHLREFNKNATVIQKVVRGRQARQRVKDHEKDLHKAVLVIQCAMRCWRANKIVRQKRALRCADEARHRAAITIQSVQRGRLGRRKAAVRKSAHLADLEVQRAAVRIQASARQKQATERVEALRLVRMQGMNNAATVIRKHWLRHIHRKRYLELRQEFHFHVSSIVTMQRYVRGFLVRLRMWRDAIRAEEELWAAVEIQRVWRGYMGRLRWELAYEAIWSREVAALRLQRYIRGWLARTRVHRMRRKHARAEFEKARRRFKAAQKIQANVRGWIVRRRTKAWRDHIVNVVITIQRVTRGHQMRCKLWQQILENRAVQIQAAARGFLIRNRRFHFIANVICIQRHYRMWLARVPQAERERRLEARRTARAAVQG
jgi:tetratricopeptide (TPR) repeat protein